MNKIYRRIWSTARQCWVVASELTAPRGKAASRCAAACAVVAASLLPSLGLEDARAVVYEACQSRSQPVFNCIPYLAQLEGSQANTLGANTTSYMMLGMSNHMQGKYSSLFGNWSRSVGDNNAVFGFDARANRGGSAVFGARSEADGFGAVALGHSAYAFGDHSIAMGRSARTVGNDGGISRIAIGGDAYAGTAGWTGAVALGGDARAEYDGIALGYGAQAKGVGSVALGRGAIATETYVVSVGNADRPRRVVYVDDGNVTMYSLDAVNGRQLLRVREKAEQGVSDAAAARAAADQALINTKLVTQTSPSSVIRVGGENTGNVLTVSNKNGDLRYLNGVRNGTLSTTSTDAVTGQQLFATNQDVTSASDRATRALAEASALGNMLATGTAPTDANKAVASAAGAFAGGTGAAASGASALAIGQDSRARGRQSMALGQGAKAEGWSSFAFGAGAHSQAESGIALGYNASVIGEDSKFSVALGERASASHANAVALGAGSVTTARNQVSVGNDREKRKIVNVADGALTATSTDAVTGQQLFATNQAVNSADEKGARALAKAEAAAVAAEQAWRQAASLGQTVASGTAASESNRAIADGAGAFAAGANAAATAESSLALGRESQARGKQSIALGRQANADAWSSFAVGAGAHSQAEGAVAFGYQAKVIGEESKFAIALGERAVASHANAVALGSGSATSAVDQVSVGNAKVKRSIVNVKDGELSATSSEAVTGRQLNATNTELSSVHTVATAAQTAASTAQATADTALGKANTLDGLLSQVAVDSNLRLGGQNSGTVLDVSNKSGAGRRLTGLAEGAINASSTEAVAGKQLFTTNERVKANEGVLAGHTRDLTAQSGRIADNRRDLDALRSEFEAFDPDLDGVVKFAADGSVDVAGGKLRGVAAGDISSAASTDAVNGGQLFATNERISSMEYGGRFFKIGTDEYSEDAYAGWFGVAIGESAEASRLGEGGVAVGGYARALATNSVALGRGSTVMQGATKGFALGAGSRVEAEGGVAFGADSKVMGAAKGSIAIGEGSIADVAGTVSLGGEGLVRRITNVGRGVGLSDASTVAQLSDALRNLGAGAGMDGSGNIITPTYNVQGGTQNNVGDALAALDSAVVTADSRVDNLEGKLRSAFQDGPSVRADGLNQLVLAGANGSVLTNLADGRIAAGSRDAVTGSQLFEAKQEIARNRNDLDDLRGERDGLLSRGLMAAEQGNVIDYGGARLTGVADGVVSAESRDVVTGRQLNQTNEMVAKLERASNSIAIYSDNESKAAQAGYLGVAVGSDAKSHGDGSTAIGSYATAESTNSTAIGRGAWVGAYGAYGIAIGSNTNVEAMYGMAFGVGSRVIRGADRSVSLGADSVALEANTLSIGNDYLQRRIVNVANGRNTTDAATVGQLRGALATLGGDVDVNGNIINPTFNVQGGQQSTLNDALSSLDAAVVTNTTRTERVESQLRAVFQDSPTVRNDGLNQLTFAGASGMVLSNVANGAIAAGSRDAVNGGQLHSMQQQLNGRMDGLEQRIDGQPQAPQSRALTVAAVDSAASSTPAATPAADAPTPPPPSSSDNKSVADAGNAPKSSPQPQADAPKPESPTPQVDTAELERMLARANEYSDGISREVDARLDKMDKRFNRMAAMSSAQSAMAMNTAGLNTYNRLGAGVGYSDGESAMAVGYQRVLNDKGSATFSLNGAFTNSGERSMGVGVGIGW